MSEPCPCCGQRVSVYSGIEGTCSYVGEELAEGRKQGLRKVVEVLVRLGYLKGDKLIDAIKPRHGNCCTCQTCGHEHDDCVCAHNELLKAIEAAIKKEDK